MIQKFAAGCPWFDLYEKYPPNIEWCEEKICSWFVTPFNAFTNFAYILVGILILMKMHKAKSRLLRFFGVAVITVGITSFVFHTSLNFFTQVIDFIGMYIFCMLLVMFNMARARKWPKPPLGFPLFYFSVVSLTGITIVMYYLHLKYQLLVFILILLIIASEFMAKAKNRIWFYSSIASLGAAAAFSAADHERILCDPENHWFQGHGMWHMLGAVALWFSYRHYLQFRDEIW